MQKELKDLTDRINKIFDSYCLFSDYNEEDPIYKQIKCIDNNIDQLNTNISDLLCKLESSIEKYNQQIEDLKESTKGFY